MRKRGAKIPLETFTLYTVFDFWKQNFIILISFVGTKCLTTIIPMMSSILLCLLSNFNYTFVWNLQWISRVTKSSTFSCGYINSTQNGPFLGCSRMWVGEKGLLPNICHTCPTMMKLGTVTPYLKKIQKYINPVLHPLSFADIRIHSQEITNFCYIKKYKHRLHFNT